MSPNFPEWVREDSRRIQRFLENTSFKRCLPVSQAFNKLPDVAAIYAIKSRAEEILYVGRTASVRTRFRNGHQALVLMFVENWQVEDIRILIVRLNREVIPFSHEIEKQLIFRCKPRYNRYIPTANEVASEMSTAKEFSNTIRGNVLSYFPPHIVDGIRDYARENGLSEEQAIEMIVAQFFDLEAMTFKGCQLESLGVLKERIAIAEIERDAARQELSQLKDEIEGLKRGKV